MTRFRDDGSDGGASEYQPVLAFDGDDPEFVRGFEAGRVWQLLRSERGQIEEVVHIANTEMIMRMAEAHNRRLWGEELEDGWMRAVIEPSVTVDD